MPEQFKAPNPWKKKKKMMMMKWGLFSRGSND
jgi:hypothetical protein